MDLSHLSRGLSDCFGLAKLLDELGLSEFEQLDVQEAVTRKLRTATEAQYEDWRQAKFLLLGPDEPVSTPFAELFVASAYAMRHTFAAQLRAWQSRHAYFGLAVPVHETERGNRIFDQWWFSTAKWIRLLETGELIETPGEAYVPNAKRRRRLIDTFTARRPAK